MPVPILASKLYIPSTRAGIVPRDRLKEKLSDGLRTGKKMSLVSAPAGFGKTTLISEWISGCGLKAAWLGLDEEDSDPTRFLSYLVAALQPVQAGIGDGLLAAMQNLQQPAVDNQVSILLNDINLVQESFILVLDDYHWIDSQSVDQALAFLIEHQPRQMHLVITTREDPDLPLARMRARGQLTELRAADLRFTPSEAAEFLNRTMSLDLSKEDIDALEKRTEGWIAGLQLAALSIQGRTETSSFIQSFTGSHRFVLDYLVEEVLERQPQKIRDFLLKTSILDRLSGPLCDAITGQEDGKEILATLERGNLFLIPLDDERKWYRYHHLFSEVLRAFLEESFSTNLSDLHRRAYDWFEQNDMHGDAIRHALAAKDFDRAADLIEKVWLVMDINYQSATWLGWVKALPKAFVLARPVVCVGCAWALLGVGELENVESYLQDAERWLDMERQPDQILEMIVVDESEFRTLPVSIAAARAYHSLTLGDIPITKKYASQALALTTDDTNIHRTQATALLGMAEYAAGNLSAAKKHFLDFQKMMWQAYDMANAISITYILSNIMLVQGRLREAVAAYQQSLQLASKRGTTVFIGASDLHRGLSELLCEQGDLQGAEQQLQIARQLGERSALTGWPHRLCIAQARIKEAQGDLPGALELLEEAERLYVRNPLPDRSIGALKARTWLRQGRVNEASAWVHEQNISPDDDLSYSNEFEQMTLARLLILKERNNPSSVDLQTAMDLLERLQLAALDGGRMGSAIEILILQSLAYQSQRNQKGALDKLVKALTLAEPESYVRVFLDEGESIRSLLGLVANQKKQPLLDYVNRLLGFFAQPESIATKSANKYLKTELVEPLSERELEVLRLLRSELTGPEIAQELVISVNTLRSHTKNLFYKLGVNNRRAVVRRAEELGLF